MNSTAFSTTLTWLQNRQDFKSPTKIVVTTLHHAKYKKTFAKVLSKWDFLAFLCVSNKSDICPGIPSHEFWQPQMWGLFQIVVKFWDTPGCLLLGSWRNSSSTTGSYFPRVSDAKIEIFYPPRFWPVKQLKQQRWYLWLKYGTWVSWNEVASKCFHLLAIDLFLDWSVQGLFMLIFFPCREKTRPDLRELQWWMKNHTRSGPWVPAQQWNCCFVNIQLNWNGVHINNVLLVKIEGPVWYTIYHHLPVVFQG